MATKTRTINGETCTVLGKGEFCVAYRSTENPATVYLITPEGDNVKEILKHCSGDHIPTMVYVDEYETRNKTYTIWQTEYSYKLTASHKQAWELAKILRKTWDAHYTYCKKDQWYERCYNFIEALREDDRVPESIVHDLDVIYGWATAFGPNFLFEFPNRNLGVKDDGTLVLRDIVFFR
jgi:hypothetical protein